jgi:membrane-associated phospholipid phosphatase
VNGDKEAGIQNSLEFATRCWDMQNKNFLLLLIIICFGCSRLSAQAPYQLSMPEDGILIGAGLPLLYYGYLSDSKVEPINQVDLEDIDRSQVNGFDRLATYYYSESKAHLSDILLYSCIASPLILLLTQDVQRDAGIIYSMYGEALLFGLSLPLITKGSISRFRPYVYNPDISETIKLTSDARKSFFSGHSSLAFTSMIFFATVFSRYHADAQAKNYVWGGAFLLASAVGYLRIASGSHYPSDVLIGAIAGSAAGYLIPKIHEVSERQSPDPFSREGTTAPLLTIGFSF